MQTTNHPATHQPPQPTRYYYEAPDFDLEWRREFPFTSTGRQWGSLVLAARDRDEAGRKVRDSWVLGLGLILQAASVPSFPALIPHHHFCHISTHTTLRNLN
jgi:hypothetical protein